LDTPLRFAPDFSEVLRHPFQFDLRHALCTPEIGDLVNAGVVATLYNGNAMAKMTGGRESHLILNSQMRIFPDSGKPTTANSRLRQ
jgi:hypothetical protein